MEHRLYRKTGQEVSLLGLGAMRLPTLADGGIDEAAALALVDDAYRGGVNYFDTAFGYHEGASEPFMGKALARYPRDSFKLATKLPMWNLKSREDALRIFDEQLARCQTDYFDFYLFHAVAADGFKLMQELGLYALLDEKRKAGVIRNLGFSFHDTPEVLREVCAAYQWDFAQIQLNYIDDTEYRSGEQYAILEEYGIPCVVMEPVHGGSLANLGAEANAILKAADPDASIASWALRWVAGHEHVLCILSGMSSAGQVADNLKTMADMKPFSDAERDALAQAIETYRRHARIACTGCRYCMPCPSGVDIPGMLAMYNDCAFDGDAFNLRGRYAKWPVTGKAHNCVACGECLPKCPQKLAIPDLMTMIDERVKE